MVIKQNEFRAKLADLVGARVKQVNAGGSTGSVFVLDFCENIPSGQEVSVKSKGYIMVKCSWRLDDAINHRPITGWQEDSSVDGVMTLRLKSLSDDIVSRIEISPFNDLELYFQSGKRLFIFCDITPYVIGDYNWFLGAEEANYSVNLNLKCIKEEKGA